MHGEYASARAVSAYLWVRLPTTYTEPPTRTRTPPARGMVDGVVWGASFPGVPEAPSIGSRPMP